MTKSTSPPILFIIFNRPDLTKQVFSEIRNEKPCQLYVAADGPRKNNLDDVKLCKETRKIIREIDWECDVKKLYRPNNLGCKEAVSSAIDWFFDHVEAGIILEDDCIPHSSFFRFCSDLLDHYRHQENVMMISGNNFQYDQKRTNDSYYFSIYTHIWGWATWRRAWSKYDKKMTSWETKRKTSFLEEILNDQIAEDYWKDIFDRVSNNKIDTWDYQWTYTCWVNNGLTILPENNLVTNIGFDNRATHTKTRNKAANLEVSGVEFPLSHPERISPNKTADYFSFYNHFLEEYHNNQISDPDIVLQALEQANKKNFTPAIDLFNIAIKKNPKLPGLLFGKAYCLANSKNYSEANKLLRKTLIRMPNHQSANCLKTEISRNPTFSD